jgi:hypothetical protein
MFRLIRLIRIIGFRNTLILLALIAGGLLVYENLFAPKIPAYTRPAGYVVTAICSTRGRDCDEYGSVRLWDDLQKTTSSFVRSPKAVFCVATDSSIVAGQTYWRIDCGLWQGQELPIIEGWVQEANLIFGEWIESREVH